MPLTLYLKVKITIQLKLYNLQNIGLHYDQSMFYFFSSEKTTSFHTKHYFLFFLNRFVFFHAFVASHARMTMPSGPSGVLKRGQRFSAG